MGRTALYLSVWFAVACTANPDDPSPFESGSSGGIDTQGASDTVGGRDTAVDTAVDTGGGDTTVERSFVANFGSVLRGGGLYGLATVPVDIATTLEAVRATGQTRLAVGANDGDPSLECPDRDTTPIYEGTSGAGHHWCSMLEIVREAAGSDVEIVALLGERHMDPEPRWLDTSDGFHLEANCGDPRPDGCYETWEPETSERFLEAWVASAQELSRLSATPGFEALIGFTIDDFYLYICGPNMPGLVKGEGCFRTEDIARISDAAQNCEGCNPEFRFWVTAAAVMGAPRSLPGSHIIGQHDETMATIDGVDSDFPVMDGDRISVDFRFSLDVVPETFELSFLFSDGYQQEEEAYADLLFSVVQIESGEDAETVEIFTSDISGNEWVQRFDEDVAEYLRSGPTTIRIGLRAADEGLYGAPASRLREMHSKLMAVWGVRMNADGVALTDYTTEYVCPDGCLEPGDEDYGGYYAGPATENSAEASDGILMRMYTSTTVYEPALFTHLFESVAEAVGERELFPITVGRVPHGTTHEIDSAVRAEELDLMTRMTDGVYIWNYPLALYGLEEQQGIFEEPDPPPDGCEGEDGGEECEDEGGFANDWDGAGRWPASESCIPGWYQEWRFVDSGDVGRNACISVKLQANADEMDPEFSFRMVVGQPDDTAAFVNTEEGGEIWSDGHLVWTEQVEFDPDQPITVRLENTDSCGNRLTISRFRVVHTDEDCGSGLYPEGTHFETATYESGFEDTELLDLYCDLGTAIQELYDQSPWSLGGDDECGGRTSD